MIVELITKNIGQSQNELYKYWPRPSSVDRCPRSLFYHATGVPPQPYPGRSLLVFEDGNIHEMLIADHIKKTVFEFHEWKGKNQRIEIATINGKRMTGEIDGLLVDPLGVTRLLEIKSINHFGFERLTDAPEDGHRRQANLYLHGLIKAGMDIREGVILYKNKNTSAMKEFVISYDEAQALADIAMFEDIEARAVKGEAPERPYAPDDWHCQYCLAPDTPVLAADFSWKRIDDIQIGENIWAFDEFPVVGKFRKSRLTTVLDKFERKAPAVKLITDRGEVVCSTDHRWLVYSKGYRTFWIEASEIQPGWRLFSFAEPIEDYTSNDEYKIGYIQAMIAGDGTIGLSSWRAIRLALKDLPALDRFQSYLKHFSIDSIRGPFSYQGLTPMEKVSIVNREPINDLLDILEIRSESAAYSAGFLAGMFDAEGSLEVHGTPRISNKNKSLLEKVIDCGKALSFTFALEPWAKANGIMSVRLYSHDVTRDLFRFFSICRPAIQRKTDRAVRRRLQGKNSWATVVSVKVMGGSTRLIDLQTSAHTFIAAGLPSHNCRWQDHCWSGYADEVKALSEDVALSEEIETAARYYNELGAQKAEIEKEREGIGETLRQALKAAKAQSARAGEYILRLSVSKRKKIDEALVPPEAIKEVPSERFTVKRIKGKESQK
jgi:hypothetical protein